MEEERIRAETARQEQAQREAEEHATQAKRAAEEKARELAAKAEQERQAREATERRRRQAILDRRAREAAAPNLALYWLDPCEMTRQICPQLTAESFRTNVFEDEFKLRRFRFSGWVAQFRRETREVVFAPASCGELHCLVVATITPETVPAVCIKREFDICGTLADVEFSAGVTNLNGIRGRVCTIHLGNAAPTRRVATTKSVVKSPPTHEAVHVPVTTAAAPMAVWTGSAIPMQDAVRIPIAPTVPPAPVFIAPAAPVQPAFSAPVTVFAPPVRISVGPGFRVQYAMPAPIPVQRGPMFTPYAAYVGGGVPVCVPMGFNGGNGVRRVFSPLTSTRPGGNSGYRGGSRR